MSAATGYCYNRLTWDELDEPIGLQKLVILPTGSAEQHGRHLPLDVDVFLTESVCLEVGKRAPENVLVLPPISYGLNLHHIDFPGTIHIEPEVFIAFCLNVTKCLVYHGFEKILLVNGHGSNAPLVDLIARRTTLETNSLAAACNSFSLAQEAFDEIKDTAVAAHADEFETSLYLYLAPARVQMDKAGAGDDVMGTTCPSTAPRPTSASTTTGRVGPISASTGRHDRHGREGARHLRRGRRPVAGTRGRVARRADREASGFPQRTGAGADRVVTRDRVRRRTLRQGN